MGGAARVEPRMVGRLRRHAFLPRSVRKELDLSVGRLSLLSSLFATGRKSAGRHVVESRGHVALYHDALWCPITLFRSIQQVYTVSKELRLPAMLS
jgi:hypothetical protein